MLIDQFEQPLKILATVRTVAKSTCPRNWGSAQPAAPLPGGSCDTRSPTRATADQVRIRRDPHPLRTGDETSQISRSSPAAAWTWSPTDPAPSTASAVGSPATFPAALPAEYQRILTAVRQAAGPVSTRQIGEVLGLDTGVRGKLEPLRGKLAKLADRGWLHKRPDGKFTTRP